MRPPRQASDHGSARPLYARVLGPAFDGLPPLVRALHDLDGAAIWTGRADVERGRALVCRALAMIFRLPPAGRDLALTVSFQTVGDRERWLRVFGTQSFPSTQWAGDGGILERIGSATITLVPVVTAEALTLSVGRLTVLGIPMPAFLVPRVATREFEADGRYNFQVEAALPGLGRLIRYTGWLERAATPATSATRS